jgi:hypothetical protein
MRWVRQVTHMGEKRNPYRILVGKQQLKKPLGRPRLRLEDKINTDQNDIQWENAE